MPPRFPHALRWLGFGGALSLLSVTWFVLLPWVGRQPVVAQHIEKQERQGIDPSAMFYSELEIVPAIAHRIERLHETQGDAFWSRGE